MYNSKSLICIRENKQIVLLNTSNLHWAKMSEDFYNNARIKEDEFYKLLDDKYQLFTGIEKKIELKSIYFSVTGKCNLKCEFCAMNSGPEFNTKEELAIDEIKNILLPQISLLKPRKFIITGGEPLVRDDIFEILQAVKAEIQNCRIVFQTNGLLLTEDNITEIAKYISCIEISIENIFENPVLLNKMEKLFDFIKNSKLNMTFSFVIDLNTLSYIEQAIELKRKYGVTILFRIVSMIGRATISYGRIETINSESVVRIYYRILKFLVDNEYFDDDLIEGFIFEPKTARCCGAFGQILAFHSNGDVFMCSNLNDCEYELGNIRNTSLESVIKNLEKKMEKSEVQSVFCVNKNEYCKECEIAYFCSGPCAAEFTQMKNRSEDSKCLIKKVLIKYRLFYMDKKRTREENLKKLLRYIEELIENLDYY